jgi:Tol biopolymer transport system component
MCPDELDFRFYALIASDRNGDIALTNMATCETTITLVSSQDEDTDPSLAEPPGSTMLAFSSDRDTNFEIYFSSGTLFRNLTSNAAADIEPSLSPDGTQIAFVSNRDGNNEIYTIDIHGSNLNRLTNNSSDDRQPDWSPDGQKIVFSSDRNGSPQIYTMNSSDGSGITRITTDPGSATNPSWRKLSDWIAFQYNSGDNTKIGLYDIEEDSVTYIANYEWSDEQPEWYVTPQGTPYIIISSRPDNSKPYHLYIMTLDGYLLWQFTPEDKEDRKPSGSLALF